MTTKIRRLVLALFLSFCLVALLYQIQETWAQANRDANAIAPEYRLYIDGINYLVGGNHMAANHRRLFTKNYFISSGMVVWVATALRWGGPAKYILYVKRAHVVFFGMTILFSGLLGFFIRKKWLDAFLVATLVSFSQGLSTYCLMIQYEVPLCFFLTFFVWLLWDSPNKVGLFSAGAVISVCAIIRPHFLLLLPFTGIYFYGLNRKSFFPPLLAGFTVLAIPWNLLYSLRSGTLYFFYPWLEGYPLERSLNSASLGVNFPFPYPTGPAGWIFIICRPIEYLSLLGKRFLALTGLRPDYWFIDPWPSLVLHRLSQASLENLSRVTTFILTAAIFAGLYRTLARRPAKGALLLIPISACVVPHLFINSSTRFLVPLIPLFILALFSLAPTNGFFFAKEPRQRPGP